MNINESYILDDDLRKWVNCYDNYQKNLKEQETTAPISANQSGAGLTNQQANKKLSGTLDTSIQDPVTQLKTLKSKNPDLAKQLNNIFLQLKGKGMSNLDQVIKNLE